jgi:hypothetical protein
MVKKRTKISNNLKHHTDKGIRTRSSLETKILNDLDSRDVSYGYETIRVPYTVVSNRNYTPDVILNGGEIWVEIKGWFKPEDRAKMRHIKSNYPDQDIRFVFAKPYNYLSSRSKTTYAQWCDKHGFIWAEKTIPNEWVK